MGVGGESRVGRSAEVRVLGTVVVSGTASF